MSNKPLAYIDTDGVLTIRASGAGKCVRAMWAALEEVQPMSHPDYLEDIFAEGHLHEQAVRELLESEGAVIDDQAEVVYWALPEKVKFIGHLDGDIGNWNQIWENKAFGKDGFRRFKNVGFDAYPEYEWQISIYMYGTGKDALYTVKSRDSGEIIRMVLTEPPITEHQLRVKALTLYRAWQAGSMPDCDPERYGCSFFFLHDEAKEEEMVMVDDPYVEACAGALLDVRLAMKEMGEKEKGLKEDLKKKLSTGKHLAGMYEVEIQKITSRKLDQDMLREAGIDPNDYKKESSYEVIKIKEKK